MYKNAVAFKKKKMYIGQSSMRVIQSHGKKTVCKYGKTHTPWNKYTIKSLYNKFMKTGTVVDAHNSQRQTVHMQKLLGTGAAMKMSKEISKEVSIESNISIRCTK